MYVINVPNNGMMFMFPIFCIVIGINPCVGGMEQKPQTLPAIDTTSPSAKKLKNFGE